jgi:hypothetical protein
MVPFWKCIKCGKNALKGKDLTKGEKGFKVRYTTKGLICEDCIKKETSV